MCGYVSQNNFDAFNFRLDRRSLYVVILIVYLLHLSTNVTSFVADSFVEILHDHVFLTTIKCPSLLQDI